MFIDKSAVEFNSPWAMFCSVRAVSLVMVQTSRLEIPSEADIGLIWMTFTPENANIKHTRDFSVIGSSIARDAKFTHGLPCVARM